MVMLHQAPVFADFRHCDWCFFLGGIALLTPIPRGSGGDLAD
jgi:hypothetical protein